MVAVILTHAIMDDVGNYPVVISAFVTRPGMLAKTAKLVRWPFTCRARWLSPPLFLYLSSSSLSLSFSLSLSLSLSLPSLSLFSKSIYIVDLSPFLQKYIYRWDDSIMLVAQEMLQTSKFDIRFPKVVDPSFIE